MAAGDWEQSASYDDDADFFDAVSDAAGSASIFISNRGVEVARDPGTPPQLVAPARAPQRSAPVPLTAPTSAPSTDAARTGPTLAAGPPSAPLPASMTVAGDGGGASGAGREEWVPSGAAVIEAAMGVSSRGGAGVTTRPGGSLPAQSSAAAAAPASASAAATTRQGSASSVASVASRSEWRDSGTGRGLRRSVPDLTDVLAGVTGTPPPVPAPVPVAAATTTVDPSPVPAHSTPVVALPPMVRPGLAGVLPSTPLPPLATAGAGSGATPPGSPLARVLSSTTTPTAMDGGPEGREGPSPLEGVPLRNVDTGEVVPLALAPHEDFDTLEGFSRETYMMQHGPRAGAVDSSPGTSSASPAGPVRSPGPKPSPDRVPGSVRPLPAGTNQAGSKRDPTEPMDGYVKVTTHSKDTKELNRLALCQRLGAHSRNGEMVWVVKFSLDGQYVSHGMRGPSSVTTPAVHFASHPHSVRYLATAGGTRTGGVVRVWRVRDATGTRAPPPSQDPVTASAGGGGRSGGAGASSGSGGIPMRVGVGAVAAPGPASSRSSRAGSDADGGGEGVRGAGGAGEGGWRGRTDSGGSGAAGGAVPSGDRIRRVERADTRTTLAVDPAHVASEVFASQGPQAARGLPGHPDSEAVDATALPSDSVPFYAVNGTDLSVFEALPFREYRGHSNYVVDLAWSRSQYLLSAGMDNFVRLWHMSTDRCLHKLQHPDCVSSVAFHPTMDRYFLSGCFDKKLRVWNLETGRVVLWQPTTAMVTAVTFSPDARLIVAGLLNGTCTFYLTEGMRYLTQVECRNRRGPMKRGRKVTGLVFTAGGSHLLVSTNDSRCRLLNLDDYSTTFNPSGDFIVSGSECGGVYVWRTKNEHAKSRLFNFNRTKNSSYEVFHPPHRGDDVRQLVAVFAPVQTAAIARAGTVAGTTLDPTADLILVTADSTGMVHVFENVHRAGK